MEKTKIILPTAAPFIEKLHFRSDEERHKIQRYFKSGEGDYSAGDTFIGVKMGQVFELAKEFIDMPHKETEPENRKENWIGVYLPNPLFWSGLTYST